MALRNCKTCIEHRPVDMGPPPSLFTERCVRTVEYSLQNGRLSARDSDAQQSMPGGWQFRESGASWHRLIAATSQRLLAGPSLNHSPRPIASYYASGSVQDLTVARVLSGDNVVRFKSCRIAGSVFYTLRNSPRPVQVECLPGDTTWISRTSPHCLGH